MTEDGLRFFYGSYGMGSYAAGEADFTIPYSALNGVLKPEYFPDFSDIPDSSAPANSSVPTDSSGETESTSERHTIPEYDPDADYYQ